MHDTLAGAEEIMKVLKRQYGQLSNRKQMARQRRAAIICQLFQHCLEMHCKQEGIPYIPWSPTKEDFQAAFRLQDFYQQDLSQLEVLFYHYLQYVSYLRKLRERCADDTPTKHVEIGVADFERCTPEVRQWLERRLIRERLVKKSDSQ